MLKYSMGLCVVGMLVSLGGCEPYEEPLPRRDRLNFPIGLELHPAGKYLYVVNSNFDSRYSPEQGGTVSVVDTDTFELLPAQSPFIPSFGGSIKLNDSATKAYITTRSGDNLVVLDVQAAKGLSAGSALTCPNEDGAASADSSACALHRIPDTKGSPELDSDPFGLEVVTVERGGVLVDVAAISYLTDNLVSAVALPSQSREAASMTSAPLLQGGNQIARRPGTLEMYVAGRSTNQVAVFTPYINADGTAEAIFSRRTVTLNTLATTVDSRGLAFGSNGKRLYVSTRRPDALHIFDLVPTDLEDGSGLKHELRDVVILDSQPSDVHVHRVPGSNEELIFVPCYDDNNIQVVDPELGSVRAVIELDEAPYDFISEASVSGRCGAPGESCRGYVSLFSDSPELSTSCDDTGSGCGSVAVIELDPASDRYLQVIAKIR